MWRFYCSLGINIWWCIWRFDKIPALISPLDDVMILMGMSLAFGIVHIYVGLGIKGYMLIRDGKALDASI